MVCKAAQELGKKGGSVKSAAKAKAARENAKKPRGKWVTGVAYTFFDPAGRAHEGLILLRGKWLPETTAEFPTTRKLLEQHAKAECLHVHYLEVEHIKV
jgi:hypothetical protein